MEDTAALGITAAFLRKGWGGGVKGVNDDRHRGPERRVGGTHHRRRRRRRCRRRRRWHQRFGSESSPAAAPQLSAARWRPCGRYDHHHRTTTTTTAMICHARVMGPHSARAVVPSCCVLTVRAAPPAATMTMATATMAATRAAAARGRRCCRGPVSPPAPARR
jgi:hypothetical protein